MGGMVLETNMTEIMTRINEQEKLEKEEVRSRQKKKHNFEIHYKYNFNFIVDGTWIDEIFWNDTVLSRVLLDLDGGEFWSSRY